MSKNIAQAFREIKFKTMFKYQSLITLLSIAYINQGDLRAVPKIQGKKTERKKLWTSRQTTHKLPFISAQVKMVSTI